MFLRIPPAPSGTGGHFRLRSPLGQVRRLLIVKLIFFHNVKERFTRISE